MRLGHIASLDFISGSPSRTRPGCFEHKVEEKVDAIVIGGIKLPGIGRTIGSKWLVTVKRKFTCVLVCCVSHAYRTLDLSNPLLSRCAAGRRL